MSFGVKEKNLSLFEKKKIAKNSKKKCKIGAYIPKWQQKIENFEKIEIFQKL